MRALPLQDQCPYTHDSRELPCPFRCVSKNKGIYESQGRLLPDIQCASTLILDFLVSTVVRNEFLLLVSQSVAFLSRNLNRPTRQQCVEFQPLSLGSDCTLPSKCNLIVPVLSRID